MHALISVSDKTGVVEFARELRGARHQAALDRRHRQAARRRRPRRHRGRRAHRLSGDARRPRQDAAPEDPRRPARAPRPAASTWPRSPSTASRRSTCSSSTSIRSRRPSPSPAARSTTRSRTSTSAARRWCARRRRTGSDVAVLTDASQYAGVLAELKSARRACREATQFALAVAAFNRIAALRRRDQRLPLVARRPERRHARAQRIPGARRTAASSSCRTCATARTRTSAPRSTATCSPPPGSLVTAKQLQGKELSYNNIADADAAWECVKTFDAPACVIVKHANPCGVALGAIARRGLREGASRPIRPRPSAASSPSTARSIAPAPSAVAKQFVEVLIAPVVQRRGARRLRRQGERARAADRAAERRPGPQRATTSSASARAS